MFQHRHYEFLASWLRSQLANANSSAQHYHKCYAHDLAHRLADDNSRFNRERFLTACGIAKDEQWPRS